MRTGLLRKKITIQNFTLAQNGYGEPVKTWANFAANRWAQVTPISGNEYYQGNQQVGESTTRFTIRYISGIEPQMRVVFNSENYDIEEIINKDYRNRWIELLCRRVST